MVLLCKVMSIVLIILPVNCNTCPANCQTCTNNGGTVEVCTSCNDGYWLSGSSCQPCPDNCVTCFNSTSCETCKPGFYSPSSICNSPCPTDCLNELCEYSTGHCFACPHQRYGYMCNFDCGLCRNEQCDLRKCTDGCKPGYWQYQDGEYFECRACMDNCASCGTRTKCDVCTGGAFLSEISDTRNYCQLCPPSCKTCSSHTSCSVCEPGYFGEACEYTCSALLSDCYQCEWDGRSIVTCNQCLDDFMLQDNECVFVSQQCPENCESCRVTEDMCEICMAGWYGALCDKPCQDFPHCLACQETGGSMVCNACNVGYEVFDGECLVTSTTITSLPLVSFTTPTPTSTSTATKTSNASPNSAVPESYTSTPQPQNTSFQASTFAVGLVTGIGICVCVMLVIGLVRFLWRRKRLQKSTTTQQNEPFYENSVTAQELKPTHVHAAIENESQPTDGNQQVPEGEASVPTSTDLEQHEYTSLDVRQGEHIYTKVICPTSVYHLASYIAQWSVCSTSNLTTRCLI